MPRARTGRPVGRPARKLPRITERALLSLCYLSGVKRKYVKQALRMTLVDGASIYDTAAALGISRFAVSRAITRAMTTMLHAAILGKELDCDEIEAELTRYRRL